MFTPFAFVKQEITLPSFTGLLDLYPNAARAYSVRKLRDAYTGAALRVKRSSDNTEQDIGFVGENLDTSSLSSFVGAGNGIVVTWYDQSGNGANATATSGNEPRIVSDGVIQTTGTKTSLLALSKLMTFTAINVTRYTSLLVGKKNSATTNRLIGLSTTTTPNPVLAHWSDSQIYFQWEDFLINPTTTTGINNINYEVIIASTTSTTTAVMSRNGSALTLVSPVSQPTIGQNINAMFKYGGSDNGDGQHQELILWTSEQNANFTGIQNNINDYYSIY
jgi:hypothetical protein